MLLDDVSSDVLRELCRIHKRKMAPLKKALESAIVRAAKTDCWYDPWNRKGVRANYGILYDPVAAFIGEAEVSDILPMVEFLLEKAKRQIEHSNDEGDCAGQARYWAQKLVKAAVKKNDHHIELIDWALGIVTKDIYFLACHFVFTDRHSIEARPVRNWLISQCDCFARFAEVLRRLADDYETLAHSKAEVRNRDWRKRVSGIENRLSRNQSGSWTYRLPGHNRYEPSGACTGRECGEKWRILRIR